MPYPAGPVLTANATARILGANAGRRGLTIQNQGPGAIIFNYWPPQSTSDGWRVDPSGTLTDSGDDVHHGDWYAREIDGLGARLRVVES